jgi:phosphotriesterase-related protein
MTTINSVLGPLDTAALGFTLMHEHLIATVAGISQNYPELLGARFMDRVITGLTQAKEGGIDTIVDASTFDIGRDVSVLAEASRRSGVNIIATSGWYYDPQRFIGDWSADQFAKLFIREIQEGIAGTGIKAGILKSAADIGGVTPAGEIMLRAVARAHLQTNVPIMLHSYSPGEVGRRQLAILKEEGIDMRRVKVDHSLDTTDVEYLTWLLEEGCYLGMERCPWFTVSPKARAKTMKALIDAGWAHRLLPSHDYLLVRYIPDLPPHLQEFWRKSIDPYGFLYIKKVFFPLLQEMGVPEATLNSLCVDNPRNFFEGV